MRKGVMELCVLNLLRSGPNYGYGIAQKLAPYETLQVKESTLYLILARLQKENLISATSKASERGPARRYFSLTADGKARLAGMEAFWKDYSEDVTTLIEGASK